jgi:Domain of unknown function (DUF222)/HNH endonuclease
VAEFDRREGWGKWAGMRSCAEWVAWQCGVDPRTAREQVRVAKALGEHPLVHAAFARGELSYSKVRALTRMGEGYSEDELISLARHGTAAQLERIARAVRRISAAEADEVYEGRYLSWFWEDDGSLSVHGNLPAEDGALLVQAFDAARDAIWERASEDDDFDGGRGSAEPSPDRGSAEPSTNRGSAEPSTNRGSAEPTHSEPRHVTNAEALAAMADRSLSTSPRERTGGDRHQIVIHVDQAAFTGELPGSGSASEQVPPPAIEGAGAVTAETARRLACDASVVLLRELDGKPVSVGRKTRTIPPSIRRALGSRDRTCRFPGCERRRFLDAHHIKHWVHGGETRLDNLVHLCRHHHRLIHEGGVSVRLSADAEISFRAPDGFVLPPSPAPPRSDRRALGARHKRAGLLIHPETCQGGAGEELDLSLAVRA